MNFRLIIYLAAVVSVALPLSVVLALFFTADVEDLAFATRAISAKELSGLEPGAQYAYHVETGDFKDSPVCWLSETGRAFENESVGFRVSNAAGRAVSSVVNWIASAMEQIGLGVYDSSDTEATVRWTRLYNTKPRKAYDPACADVALGYVRDIDWVVLVVDTVYFIDDAADGPAQATMVSFEPVPVTDAECADQESLAPHCVDLYRSLIVAQFDLATRLRSYLIRIEMV